VAAKKDNPPTKPIVSRVPLPVSDSALVIDLPDGQKLVIGKMSQGTVIEVATWRGVGRPDSRTNRMMFGMSTAEIEVDPESSETASQAALQPENLIARIVNYPLALFRWLFNIQSVPKVKQRGVKRNKLIIEPVGSDSHPGTSSPQNSDTGNSSKFTLVLSRLVAKSADISKKFLAKAISTAKNLKNFKSADKPPRNQSSPADATRDLEIESWLASITEKSTKKLSSPPPVSAVKKGVKK
jgi:hypothetical protein